MSDHCLVCGAYFSEDTSCQAVFDSFLALEFSLPAYGAVHFLTVACFMIQHHRYSDEALCWIEGQLRAYFEQGRLPDQIRQQANRDADQRSRTWKVVRPPDARSLPQVHWSMTIAEVAGHFEDGRQYCALIRRWARSTLDEMKPLLL